MNSSLHYLLAFLLLISQSLSAPCAKSADPAELPRWVIEDPCSMVEGYEHGSGTELQQLQILWSSDAALAMDLRSLKISYEEFAVDLNSNGRFESFPEITEFLHKDLLEIHEVIKNQETFSDVMIRSVTRFFLYTNRLQFDIELGSSVFFRHYFRDLTNHLTESLCYLHSVHRDSVPDKVQQLSQSLEIETVGWKTQWPANWSSDRKDKSRAMGHEHAVLKSFERLLTTMQRATESFGADHPRELR